MRLNNCPIREEFDEGQGGSVTPVASPSLTQTTPSGSNSRPLPSWRDTLDLPDDIKQWQGLHNIKDPSDAIKQLYNANKLIGVEKLPKPNEKWNADQWNDFYKQIGRPESPDNYQPPKFEDENLAKALNADKFKEFSKVFHEAGLTQSQSDKIVSSFLQSEMQQSSAQNQAREAHLNQEFVGLQQEWGDKFDSNLDLAKMAFKKFGNDKLTEVLNNSGLDSHPDMIRFFNSVGKMLGESKALGSGSGTLPNSPGQAQVTLGERMSDPQWREALFDDRHPNHARVVQERADLYQRMIPAQS
jgi:hypothetical protein